MSSTAVSRTQPKPKSASPSGINRLYLTLYNGVSCGLWVVVLARVVSVLVENYTKEPFLGAVKRKENAYDETGEFVKWVQTGALLEVVHSLVGMLDNHPLSLMPQRVVLLGGYLEYFHIYGYVSLPQGKFVC